MNEICHDTQHYDTQHDDTYHNYTQHNNKKHYISISEIQYNSTEHVASFCQVSLC